MATPKTAAAAAQINQPRRARPGRPRDGKTTAAILDATIDLLAEVGLYRFRVDDVADRAGVARGTIYLRWPTKEELVMACLRQAIETIVPIPDTGSLKGDLLAAARSSAHFLNDTAAGRIFRLLLGEAAVNPVYADKLAAYHVHRRRQSREIVRRAIDRRELTKQTDPDLLIDLIIGPVFQRVVVASLPVTDKVAEEIVNMVLRSVEAGRG